MTERAPQWHEGRRNGIKWAVQWMHRRASELNDPGARAAMNVAANDLGAEAKYGAFPYAADADGEVKGLHNIHRRTNMTEAQIKHMVDRFLGWRLPETFSPDGGVSFTKYANKGTQHQHTYQPSGTNLLDGEQATAMVRYMIEGLPDDRATQGGDWLEHSNQTARKP